jgi:hypothetical protein
MSITNKLSTVVREQLPEFIRADYDTFVAFVEAYYEYLEQTNKSTDFGRNLLNYFDVDNTLTDFEEYFRRKFLNSIPAETLSNKAFLVKHIRDFWRAKGTEKAYRFLFRALYGEEIEIFYPKDNILRLSVGKWVKRQSIRFLSEFYHLATGNGSTTVFRLFEIASTTNLRVYINGVLQTSGFNISPNDPIITFDTAPANGATIKFHFASSDIVNQISRTDGTQVVLSFTGQTSGATAISEYAEQIVIGQTHVNEIFISNISEDVSFIQGENVIGRYYYEDGNYLSLYFNSLSVLKEINVVSGGASYNVGDVVPIIGGSPETSASAIIDEVYSALISRILVVRGGAGFKAGGDVVITSTPNTGLTMAINTVDSTGSIHPNTINVNSDIISLYESKAISASDYGFPATVIPTGENSATRIVDALSYASITGLGPISNVVILSSTFEFSSLPTLNAVGPTVAFSSSNTSGGSATGNTSIVTLGILGKINVANGGSNYTVGDELNFQTPSGGSGWGAYARVSGLHSSNNGIKTIQFAPSRLLGRANVTASGVTIVGTGTSFDTELRIGDKIEISNQTRFINAISSATSANVNVQWTSTVSNASIGIYDRTYIGGELYEQHLLPTITVTSATGNNSILISEAIYGDGESLLADAEFDPGQIRSILLTNPGSQYETAPTINLTGLGNGLANAVATLLSSQFTYEGKFTTTDGLLSSDRRIQDRDYYQNYSYVIQSQTDFNKYSQVLKDLIHPSGTRMFAEYMIQKTVTPQRATSAKTGQVSRETTLTGTVNVANASIVVTGTGTLFNVANTNGTITIGCSVLVNNEIRTVNNIISNTSLTVTSPFTYTSNGNTIVTIVTVVEAIQTENLEYLQTENEETLLFN